MAQWPSVTLAWNASLTPGVDYVLSVGTNSGQECINFAPITNLIETFVALQDPLPDYYFVVYSFDPVTGLFSVPSDEIAWSPVLLQEVFPTMNGFLPLAATSVAPSAQSDLENFTALNHKSPP